MRLVFLLVRRAAVLTLFAVPAVLWFAASEVLPGNAAPAPFGINATPSGDTTLLVVLGAAVTVPLPIPVRVVAAVRRSRLDRNRPAAVHLAAVRTKTGHKLRRKAFEALRQEFYESGGDVRWGYQEHLDASLPGVSGVRISQSSQMFDQASLA